MTSELKNLRSRREEMTADASVVTQEEGFAIIWAPGTFYEAVTLMTDSEGGVVVDQGYSKYFVQSCHAFFTSKERKAGEGRS